MAGFLDFVTNIAERFITNKNLSKLSAISNEYKDQVIRNSMAIGVNEMTTNRLVAQQANIANNIGNLGVYNSAASDSIYSPFLLTNMQDYDNKKYISNYDKPYENKRLTLRLFSMNSEIQDILDIICDSAIVYDTTNKFCYPDEMMISKLAFKKNVLEDINEYFNKIYLYFGFNNAETAWHYFRKFLIDGTLAFEIIYNNDGTEIIGFKELDTITLVPEYDPVNNTKIWIQYKGNPQLERKLLDSQIIYLSYASSIVPSNISYVEKLMREYNILKIMETTRIAWAVMNSNYKLKFIIPVGDNTSNRAKQNLMALMNQYREIVDFDMTTGNIMVNGQPIRMFNKEYWLPSRDGESPQIEVIGNEGPDLSDVDALNYFKDKLYLISKVPFSRFDKNSGATYAINVEQILMDEIKFEKFINRIRSLFQEILVKPLYIQMCLKYPQLINDYNFKINLTIRYNNDSLFRELKELEVFKQRIENIKNILELNTKDAEGNEVPYFDVDFLISKFLKLSYEDLLMNQSFKDKKNKKEEDKEENKKTKVEDMLKFGK